MESGIRHNAYLNYEPDTLPYILALFQSTTANKIDSEHTIDYKRLLPVWEAKILRVTVKRIRVFGIRFSAKRAENS